MSWNELVEAESIDTAFVGIAKAVAAEKIAVTYRPCAARRWAFGLRYQDYVDLDTASVAFYPLANVQHNVTLQMASPTFLEHMVRRDRVFAQ